ncbi:hypothetical protein DM01DRAFT_1331713 [Hesseltinella vesiculosa]|uniref:U2 snRNP-associated SURP motif-containing protein n=1 Tax=Hesseltinella vesiculosa TaxID=101127 RepID=A0A1X2GW60_9FUNG|nr:hypothetical protein DM01DRAFT_1331713 [Hesseltinella vesiculosa]
MASHRHDRSFAGRDAPRKTIHHRQNEESRIKEQQEREDTSRVYESFVASFEGNHGDYDTVGFVKSSTPQSATHSTFQPMAFVKAGGEAGPVSAPPLPAKRTGDHFDLSNEPTLDNSGSSKGKKVRQMDAFLEELKSKQENRSKGLKSTQDGDRSQQDEGISTNLFLSDIDPSITELKLCQCFGVFGPIASVKIMRSRPEDPERKRPCGFVSFMTRADAETALEKMNGELLDDYVVRAEWGKPVRIPATPCYTLPAPAQPPKDSRYLPFTAKWVEHDTGNGRPEVHISFPNNAQITCIIHRLVERIVRYGPKFEAAIIQREHQNPLFRFVFDQRSNDHVYYRWRLYSILQGDTPFVWRTEPFQMYDDGVWWVPPTSVSIPFDEEGPMDLPWDSDDEARERIQQSLPKGQLGKVGKQRYEVMLRQVTLQRGTIARAMAFAIDHADAYDEVINITVKALVGTNATVTATIARLFLVSDILHNSGVHVTNAWRYRDGFAQRLPDIFVHLCHVYGSISARLKAEQFRRHVMTILGAWELWLIFPKHEVEHLMNLFTNKGAKMESG